MLAYTIPVSSRSVKERPSFSVTCQPSVLLRFSDILCRLDKAPVVCYAVTR
ncbi:hypothetical protein [Oscillospiraceae bacterium]|nr:hypothetical protein [Oscillospiraceae bacterium]